MRKQLPLTVAIRTTIEIVQPHLVDELARDLKIESFDRSNSIIF